ncbi:MAG: DUF4147 domain-containing protein [bacterium]|nr:DUF4147 domain-containing protein [bacterium]
MDGRWIKNFNDIATTDARKNGLKIIESGLDAIDTEKVILNSIRLENNTLTVKDLRFNLNDFKNVKVVGFGKAACKAALTLESILGSKIKDGAVIGLDKVTCDYVETYQGNHPLPTIANVEASRHIFEISKNSDENDLVIVIVSGGGSALLCWPEKEYEQGQRLYKEFLRCGGTIQDLNTIRKHISMMKGGGLAKVLYPATVVGLIFSDVPGPHYDCVASGPTYKDASTVSEAENISEKFGLGNFEFLETPKDDSYFEKVHNVVLTSNLAALEAMSTKALELGFKPWIISSEIYDTPETIIEKFSLAAKQNSAVFAGGETCLKVNHNGGSGGRNLFLGMKGMFSFPKDSLFISFASDGMDNGPSAGAIIDAPTRERLEKSGLNIDDFIERYDPQSLFDKIDSLIFTGPTNANVSDLMMLLRQDK